MKIDDVIKGLQECAVNITRADCKKGGCPYYGKMGCCRLLVIDAYEALIQTQKERDNVMERCEIPLKLPSLNEYIDACRTNRFRAAKMKRETEEAIMVFIRKLPRFEKPVTIAFKWIEPNRRRDHDNVAFGKKFILDALVEAGKLPDDGQKYVKGFTDTFEIGDRSAVIVEIEREVKHT